MKKNFLLLLALSSLTFVSCKKEVTVTPTATQTADSLNQNAQKGNVTFTDLPAKALETINSHYSQDNIASYEVKTIPVIGKSFEVKFNDGAEIDFDSDGVWHEWKDAKGLPKEVLPEAIKTYLSKNYASTFATSIDKEKDKIKIDLATDIDLEFDTNGNFVRIDD